MTDHFTKIIIYAKLMTTPPADLMVLTLLAGGLFLAWFFPLFIVIQYRHTIVPKRYDEIRDRFLGSNQPHGQDLSGKRRESGGWHYARLLTPGAKPVDQEEAIKKQFFYFHGWGRYAAPLALIALLSGLMLTFSGYWIADYFCSQASTATSAKIQMLAPMVAPSTNDLNPL